MSDGEKGHIGWVDLAKGICILLVVLHHIIQSTYAVPNIDISGMEALAFQFYEILSKRLVPLRMPLFFMISGFLVYRGVTVYHWREVWGKRVQNIWYVYIVWSVIQWLAVASILILSGSPIRIEESMLSNYASDLPSYVKLLLFGTSSLWYLYVLPIYFIICKLLSSKPLLCISLFIFGYFLTSYLNLTFPTSSIVKNGIFYAIGCFFCPYLLPLVSKIKKKIILTVTALFMLLSLKVILSLLGLDITLFNTIILVAIMILLLNWFQGYYDIPVLCYIGKNTLPIYVIHYIIVKILGYLFIPTLVAYDFFTNKSFVTAWYLIYPFVALILVTGISLGIWKLTSVGFGKYLYKIPTTLK